MLEAQYDEMEEKVTTALKRQKRKHELVNKIIAYDKENQMLNNKIDEATKKLRELEAEVIEASAEATLLE